MKSRDGPLLNRQPEQYARGRPVHDKSPVVGEVMTNRRQERLAKRLGKDSEVQVDSGRSELAHQLSDRALKRVHGG